MADEPLSLAVGTGVSAKYKGAFCEAKIRKIVRNVKCKVLFKNGLGSYTVGDDQIKGTIRTGAVVEVRHPDKKEYSEATITKIQDCTQYTVVFDDGDITTLRRTALCLKSGKHFAESETLDQLPLTHPEHFSTPVIGGRRGRRTRVGANEASSDEEGSYHPSNDFAAFKETDIGRVVCVEGGEKRKNRDNWFPGLIVAPTAQESVPIRVRDEYLVRSFKDGRYYTVPKKEIMEFSREMGAKAETNSLKSAVEKALQFLDRDELPLHWDRDLLLYGVTDAGSDSEPGDDNESSDDEPREKKDHFVAQLYKFMDENGTPINEEPVIGSKDVDLFRLYKVVHNLGGFNRVTNQNNWKAVSMKLGFGHNPVIIGMVKQSYRKYLLSFEEWPKRPGCAMQIQPRLSRSRSRIGSGRNSALKDRAGSSPTIKTEPVEKVPESIASSVIEPAIQMPPKMPPVAVRESPAVTPRPAPAVPVTKEKPTKKATPSGPASTSAKMAVDKAERASKEPKTEPGLKLRNPKHRAVEPEPSVVVKQEIKMEVDAEEPESAPEPTIPVSKEKKKRVVPRVQKKDVPVVKGGKVDCLANTRQKRVIKERSKTIADSIKARNKSSAIAEKEVPEKVTMTKTKVKEEASVTTKAQKKEETAGPSSTDEKKKGRKRKEKSEVFDENFEPVTLPPHKTISLGDKLKVYYGPTREAKITSYEAKVLSTKEENGETLYFVHYTGWNVRYDEWIRANRIADNLSWVAGRSSKKPTQTPTPKSAKKEKKSMKSEIKTEAKASCSKEGGSTSSANSSSKDHHGNRQGSVGRSTTPSSIASSSSRSKGAVQKRPKTRATYSKKGEIKTEPNEEEPESAREIKTEPSEEEPESANDEVAEDYYSDVGSEAEDSKNAIAPLLERERTSSPQSKTKKTAAGSKDESAPTSVEVKEEKYEEGDEEEEEEEDEEEEVDDGEGEGMDPVDPKSEAEPTPPSNNDPISAVKKEEVVDVKAEVDDDEEEDDDCNEKVEEDYEDDDDEDNKEYDEDDLELLIQNSIVKEEYSDDSLGRGTPLLGFDAPTADSGSKDNTSHSAEEFLAGKSRSETDSDAGGVSAAEEISLTEVKNDVTEEDGDDGDTSEPSNEVTMKELELVKVESPVPEMETEDVYEFKEPEPFEFEARKSSDDKAKSVKRALCLQLDDKPSSPKSPKYRKTASPSTIDVQSKTYQSPTELLSKDDNSPESTPTIQTCEEAFDKICASPLRAATLDSRHIGLLENIESYEDDDNFDDDSEDRLVISERDSDNSNASCDTTAMEFMEETDIKTEPRSDDQGKDESLKDEDVEEVMEDVEPKPAAAIVETSDETSEEDTQAEPVESPNEEKKVDEDSESSGQEVRAIVAKETTDKDTDSLAADEEDLGDAASEPEDESQPETSVIDTCPDAAEPDDAPAIKVEPIEEVDSGEAADVEEDENNLESLICEETIPGSPPSQVDSLCQMEEKRLGIEEDDNMFKNEPELSSGAREATDSKNLVQVVRVGRCPSTTPESNESSTPSPPRESSETTGNQNERKPDKDTTDATTSNEPSFKKDTGKVPSDGRSKKAEAKTPAKRGRKAKKKSEDAATTRKKYSKHVKHQGSESDDGNYDGSGSSGRGDSSSRTLHPYRRNFLIPQDKLTTMDVAQRITTITQAMQDLRMTYNSHKTELAAIDKRRKRIRRREREDAARLSSARSH